ncbi:hypothetical protein BJV74DRAFT_345461 [Russula compacta]|nr:hypothetical protein BJV74DRAFT_345461 [Russula compacta]
MNVYKARLGILPPISGDEDGDGLTLYRILHGQSLIAKTDTSRDYRGGQAAIHRKRLRRHWGIGIRSILSRTSQSKLTSVHLQFARIVHHIPRIDIVSCNIDGRVYIRKSIEKRFASKTRDVRDGASRFPKRRGLPNQKSSFAWFHSDVLLCGRRTISV